jgi:hypothetical protein
MKGGFMKHLTRIFLVMVLVFGMIGCATAEKKPDWPGTLEVLTPVLDLSNKETDVKLKGTGFTPDQEIMVLITDVDGIRTDVGWALDPQPKADANGTWETTWDAKRFVDRKLVKAGEYSITVTDADYNEIDAQPVQFTGKLPKKKKK